MGGPGFLGSVGLPVGGPPNKFPFADPPNVICGGLLSKEGVVKREFWGVVWGDEKREFCEEEKRVV